MSSCVQHSTSDLGVVVQAVRLSLASVLISQFQFQGLKAAGTQRAAEQLQEQRAGHYPRQLEQKPPAT